MKAAKDQRPLFKQLAGTHDIFLAGNSTGSKRLIGRITVDDLGWYVSFLVFGDGILAGERHALPAACRLYEEL